MLQISLVKVDLDLSTRWIYIQILIILPSYPSLWKSYLMLLEIIYELHALFFNAQGTLADGTIIAVKQLSSKSRQGNREFVNEIGMMSGLHHPNLVRLYGCCVERNQLLLAYEYMENNNLTHVLFGKCYFSILDFYMLYLSRGSIGSRLSTFTG